MSILDMIWGKGDRTNRIFQENLDCMSCPEATNTNVEFPRDIWNDIKEIRNQFLPNEMAVFLLLEKEETKYVVKDYMIPKQNVGRANVEILEQGPSDIIGHLHSHGTFGAFFSSVDRSHFNYDVQMVIGAPSGMNLYGDTANLDGLSTICVTRTQTSCGRVMQQNAKVRIIEPPPEPKVTPGLENDVFWEYMVDKQPTISREQIRDEITKVIDIIPMTKIPAPVDNNIPVRAARPVVNAAMGRRRPDIIKSGVQRTIKGFTASFEKKDPESEIQR